MKNLSWFILAFAMAIIAAPGCDFDDDGPFRDCVEGKGPEVTRVLDMPTFTGIDLDVAANVFVTQPLGK